MLHFRQTNNNILDSYERTIHVKGQESTTAMITIKSYAMDASLPYTLDAKETTFLTTQTSENVSMLLRLS